MRSCSTCGGRWAGGGIAHLIRCSSFVLPAVAVRGVWRQHPDLIEWCAQMAGLYSFDAPLGVVARHERGHPRR